MSTDVRRRVLAGAGIVAAFLLVVVSVAAAARVLGAGPAAADLVTELVLAVLVVLVLSRTKSWGSVGFTRLHRRRDLRLYWLLAFPLIPVLPAAVTGMAETGPARLAYVVALAGLVGFVEEVVFRGALLRVLLPAGVWPAVVASSVCFGLLHLVNLGFGAGLTPTLLQVGYATALGFGLAAVTVRTGSIWPAVVLHALTDLSAALTGHPGSAGVTATDAALTGAYATAFVATGVVVLGRLGVSTVTPAVVLRAVTAVGR